MIINASPLIILAKINKLEILKKTYGGIEIAGSVYQEVVVNGLRINSRDALIAKEQIDSRNIDVLDLRPEFTEKQKKSNPFMELTLERQRLLLWLCN